MSHISVSKNMNAVMEWHARYSTTRRDEWHYRKIRLGTLSPFVHAHYTSPGPTAPLPSRIANRAPCHKRDTPGQPRATQPGVRHRPAVGNAAASPRSALRPPPHAALRLVSSTTFLALRVVPQLSSCATLAAKINSTRLEWSPILCYRTEPTRPSPLPQFRPLDKPTPTATVHIKRLKLQASGKRGLTGRLGNNLPRLLIAAPVLMYTANTG